MEKTLQVHLQEQRKELIETIARKFEDASRREILSDYHSNNDCAVIENMWLQAAGSVRNHL